MSNEFRTLATHLAGKDVEIVFEGKNAIPRTDGKVIYLPSNVNRSCIYPTIAATLHESHHVKLSDFSDVYGIEQSLINHFNSKGLDIKFNSQLAKMTVNLLEDIRIDAAVFTNFCNAKQLYRFLIDQVERTREPINGDDTCARTLIFRIMEYMYLTAVDCEDLFTYDTALSNFLKTDSAAKVIDAIIKKSVEATSTKCITTAGKMFVDLITTILKNEKVKEELEKERQKKIDKAKEGLNGLKDDYNDKKKSRDNLEDKQNDINKEVEKLNKDLRDIRQKHGDDWNKINEDKEYQKKQDELNKKYSEQSDNDDALSQAKQDFHEVHVQKCNLEDKKEKLERDITETIMDDIDSNGCGYGNGMVNFKSLTKNFKINKREDVPQFAENIETIFSRLTQKPNKSETTGKINVKNIYKIFDSKNTNLDDIFTSDKRKREFSNKLMVLMDVSGSMRGKKMTTMTAAVGNLLRVVDANKEAFNIDYSVATYSSKDCYKFFKQFGDDKKINFDSLEQQMQEDYCISWGGTDIIPSLEKTQEYLEMESDLKDNRYVLVFTDGEFASDDIKIILDKYNAEREKIIFVAIGNEYTKERMRYANDTTKKFFKEVLMGRTANTTKAMEKTLLEGFDKIIDR